MPGDRCPNKTELRAAMLAWRNALPAETVQDAGMAIAREVQRLPIFASVHTIAGYLAIGQEAPTEALLRAALAHGKQVALPRTLRRERRLVLHRIDTLDGLQPGPYGIPEPTPDLPEIDPADVELFLVPGAVFDVAGNRIGYGAGYYDSLLAQSAGWRVALAYAGQLAPHVPTDKHDIPMDVIVTEYGPIDCRQGQQATDHLRLRNMVFYGHHGVFTHEREQGIRLAVDVDLRLDLQLPGLTDNLTTTVDYPAVYQLINRIQSEQAFALFEALVEQIAIAILRDFTAVAEVTVTARKFNPPVGGLIDAFEVEITRTRPAWI